MARTFIGELIFRFKDEASAKAQQAAKTIGGSVGDIERAAKRLSNAPWGGKLQRDLEKLGASGNDLDKLRLAWERLHSSMASRNLSKAARSVEIANFEMATRGHFAAINAASQAQFKAMETRTQGFSRRLQNIMKPALVMMGGYTGAYMVGIGARAGVRASGSWEREKFRQETASIPEAERERIIAESERLGGIYSSVGITEIAEMGRMGRALMGDTERAMEVLPTLVKGMVALQSAKGMDAAVSELNALLRGIDVSGQNGGELGTENTKEIISGLIRAAQVEGRDLDVGTLWQFMRRAKIAGPGFSTEFLSMVAPAIMQDATSNTAGTALSSAFQAFVIGAKSTASKVNVAEQMRLGIRGKDGLVGAQLMGENPYQWVKEVLVPALQKDGVDLGNDTAISTAVAKLSMNTNATSMLARMIQQQDQIDRNIAQYRAAMGPDAADQARFKDPFVAAGGFVESLRNLAAAVGEDTMPTIVRGLSALTGGINTMQQAWRDGDPLAKAGILGGAAGAAYGTWKIATMVWGLMTAGANLNLAAASLQAAALSLGGAGAVGKAGAAAATAGASGSLLSAFVSSPALWVAAAAAAGIVGVGLIGRDANRENKKPAYRDYSEQYSQEENAARNYKQWNGFAFEGGMHRAGIGAGPKPGVAEAQQAGKEIEAALSVTGKPALDLSALDQGIAKAREFADTMQRALSLAAKSAGSADAQMRRNFADYGVAP